MPEQPNEDETPLWDKKLPAKTEEDPPKRDYYYDDAHGYQTYDPDTDAEDQSEDERKPGQDLTRCSNSQLKS